MIKRHPLYGFFFLAFLFSWLVWGSMVGQARGVLGWHIPGIFAFVGVATAAYLTAALSGGWPAVRDLLVRLVRWRAHPLWYLISVVLIPLVAYLTIAISAALRPGNSARIGQDLTLSAAVLYFFTNLPNMWLTEETAWRGFALPRLQSKYSALTASLIIGALWGCWHLPLFFIPGSFQSAIPFTGFLIAALATSVLTTWIYNHSKGSVLMAAIFHSATDAAISYTGVMSSGQGMFWIFVCLLSLTAIVVTIGEGPARLIRHKEIAYAQYPDPSGNALETENAI
jgi:uncharacterized protein